jgi:hypothetical protein
VIDNAFQSLAKLLAEPTAATDKQTSDVAAAVDDRRLRDGRGAVPLGDAAAP